MHNSPPRPNKRDPLKQDPLSQPGDSLQHELHDLLTDKVLFWIVLVAVFACVTLIQWITWLGQKPIPPAIMTIVTAAVVVVAIMKVRTALRRARRLKQGLRGEMAVGQQLETLRAKGYRVYHDLPGNGFNFDHVLVGPGGVFVIETKTISKSAVGNPTIKYDGERVLVDGHAPDRDPVAQARACRDHICEILTRTTGLCPKTRGVVLYPGWWVDKQPRGVEVWVLNPEAFVKFLDHEPVALKPHEIGIFSEALEAHLRARG